MWPFEEFKTKCFLCYPFSHIDWFITESNKATRNNKAEYNHDPKEEKIQYWASK